MPVDLAFAERLRQHRLGKGLTQRQAAEDVPIPYMTYVKAENGSLGHLTRFRLTDWLSRKGKKAKRGDNEDTL